jgi:Zn-dependent peptidase ImmA (M78 family)/transcriptional regulator with XRE-family HTH domain
MPVAEVRAHTTPEVLRWAREAAQLSVDAAARKAGVTPERLEDAEAGKHLLTIRQARLVAAAYGRSFAFLLRPEPPDEPSVATKFRHLRDAPPPPWSPDLVRLEREIRERQDAAVALYAAMGDDPPWREGMARLGLPDSLPTPDTVRAVLDLSPPALRAAKTNDLWHSRRVVLRAIEWTGVLVVRQRIPDQGVRGFLLPHDEAPAIYVNSGEDPRAQTFTILHEFAHLLLLTASRTRQGEEDWCEQFASEVLMPQDEFSTHYRAVATGDAIGTAKALAFEFGVTPFAAATRARRLGLFTVGDLIAVRDRPTRVAFGDGGNGNRNKVARLSPTFTDLVLAAADSSAVTLTTASRLLRTKVDDFDKLREFSAQALAG